MMVVIFGRIGALTGVFPVHIDAFGNTDRWGAARIVWRLPLLAASTTAVNLVFAWSLAGYDRFAGRFIVAAGLIVHLIVWVALFDLV